MDNEKASGRYSFSEDIDVKALVQLAALKEYRLMDICGHEVLFSEDGFVAANGEIGNCRVYWLVNYCGMVLTDEEFDFGADGYLEVGPDDWGFHEIELTIEEYLKRNKNEEERNV